MPLLKKRRKTFHTGLLLPCTVFYSLCAIKEYCFFSKEEIRRTAAAPPTDFFFICICNRRSGACSRRKKQRNIPFPKAPSGRELASECETEGACGTMTISLATLKVKFPCFRTLPHPTPSGAPSRREPMENVRKIFRNLRLSETK